MIKIGKYVLVRKTEHERLLLAAQEARNLRARKEEEQEKYKPSALCEGCAHLLEKEEQLQDDWGGPSRRCTVLYCRKNNTCPDHTCDVAKDAPKPTQNDYEKGPAF